MHARLPSVGSFAGAALALCVAPACNEHPPDLVEPGFCVLQQVEDRKQQIFPDMEVLISLVAGVNSDGSVTYRDSLTDPAFQQDFGIGPGCQSQSGRAVPPVRLRELADAFQIYDQRNMVSICDGDYTPALEPIAERLASQLKPPCVPACAADMDPSTPDVLDPSCTLVQDAPDTYGAFEDIEIPPCDAGEALPDGYDVCHVMRTGDALDDFCRDSGYNLEYQLVRRENVYVPPGTVIRAECAVSGCPALDCPELPP